MSHLRVKSGIKLFVTIWLTIHLRTFSPRDDNNQCTLASEIELDHLWPALLHFLYESHDLNYPFKMPIKIPLNKISLFLSNPGRSRRQNLGLTLFLFVTTTRMTMRMTRTLTKNFALPGYSGGRFSAYSLITTPIEDSSIHYRVFKINHFWAY